MIDLETEHLNKPETVYARYMRTADHHRKMAAQYELDAEQSNGFLPDTKAYWKQHCMEQVARHTKDCAEWEAMADNWKDKT